MFINKNYKIIYDMIKISLLVILFTSICPGIFASANQKPIEATFSIIVPRQTKYYGDVYATPLDAINEACEGKLVINTFYGGLLYGTTQATMEALSSNEIQIAMVDTNTLGLYDKAWNLINAPGVINNYEHLERFMETDAYKTLTGSLVEKNNLKVLGFVWSPPALLVWNSVKSVVTPDDWKGMKIRTAAHVPTQRAVQAFGASPIYLDMGEVASAVSQGVVDGVMTSAISAVQSYQAIDMLPYLTIGQDNWPLRDSALVLLANADWYENVVPGDIKTIIEETVAVKGKEANDLFIKGLEECIKIYEDSPKTTVVYLTKEETEVFYNIVENDVMGEFRAEFPDLLQAADSVRTK